MVDLNLQLRELSKNYKDRDNNTIEVLKEISLDIRDGEIISIVGPSGCGKSTLLRIIAGLECQTAGQVVYKGKVIDGSYKDCGFVFQDPNLFPWLNLEDNIGFGLKAKGLGENKESIDRYIELMSLAGFEKAYPNEISGGMASRTSLARAFILKPSLLLLDEPLSALDAFTKMNIQDEILNIWQEMKPTIILVTHDIEEAIFLSDRVLILSNRPSSIIEDLKIDLGRPRDRTSLDFIAVRKHIMSRLMRKGE